MPRPLRAALFAAVIATMLPVSQPRHGPPAPRAESTSRRPRNPASTATCSPRAAREAVDARPLLAHAGLLALLRLAHHVVPRRLGVQGRLRDLPRPWLAKEHPDWILKDASGSRLYIPYNCDGGACTQYAADIGNPGWRRHYIDPAKARIARGYRGIFVDDVNLAFKVSNGTGQLVAPIDPRTGEPMTHTTGSATSPSSWSSCATSSPRAPRSCTTRSTSTSGSPVRTCGAPSSRDPHRGRARRERHGDSRRRRDLRLRDRAGLGRLHALARQGRDLRRAGDWGASTRSPPIS